MEVSDKHAPLERKLLKVNHASYVSKSLQKATIRRSYLEKVYFKNHKENSLKAFKKQKKTSVVGCIKKKERNFSII